MYQIVNKKNLWFIFSGTLVGLATLSLVFWGLKLGIDFNGGSLLEVSYSQNRPQMTQIEESLKALNITGLRMQPSGDNDYFLRFEEVDENRHQEILKNLSEIKVEGTDNNQLTELRFESVGPVIGKELKAKAIQSIIIVLIFMVLYIAYAFRKVSKPVASWKYGAAAIVALVHDILIVTGVFSVLGHFLNVEIDSLFVTALLTILGFSVHDTIVVFDRTRENLFKHQDKPFPEIVNMSINQTLARSINTSFTTLLALLAVYFFGGESIQYFALALIIGIIIGTYSSIFVASILLVVWNKKA